MNKTKPIVSVVCCTYNHESYIRQCLEGFVMQKTNFAFEVLVHDDASTDKTVDIIREYETKYPDIIKPIYQIENQYSKGVRINAIFNYPRAKGKYLALCEGDDYWIDPLKLQKQVDFLETNPDYSMCCSDAVIKTNELELDWKRYTENRIIPIKDIILGGGLFIQTATLLYRYELILEEKYPDFAKRCHVGDYPLQIFAALTGKVFWFADKMAVYRFQVGNSWTNINKSRKCDDKMIKGWQSEIMMLKGMDKLSNGKYHDIFIKRITTYVLDRICRYSTEFKMLSTVFADEIRLFSRKQKIVLLLSKLGIYNFLVRIYHILH